MGVVGCILGFLVVIYLCYKDWSVYIASIVGAAVVIAFNVLPFMDTLLDSYVNGMFVPIKASSSCCCLAAFSQRSIRRAARPSPSPIRS